MLSATRSEPDRGTEWLPIAFLTWAMLALGWGVLHNGAHAAADLSLVLAGFAVAALTYWLSARGSILAPSPVGWERWLILFLPGFVGLQLIPLPHFLLKILSPERASVLESLRPVVQTGAFASLSVDPAATFSYLYRVAGYVLVFLLVRDLTARLGERRSWLATLPLVLIGAVEAWIGVAQSLSGPDVRVRGTYVNRNHFAGLMEMTLPLTLACAAVLLRRERRRQSWHAPRALTGYTVLCSAALIFLALVRSDSKSGFAAALSGLFVMGALWSGMNLAGRKRAVTIGGLALVLLLIFVSVPSIEFIFGLGEGVVRDSRIDLEGRTPIWNDSRNLIRHFAVFGSGLGTYATAFLKYQTSGVDLHFQFAHNDYVQLAAELGLIGLVILCILCGRVLWRTARASTHGPPDGARLLSLGCLGAFTAILVHSFTDFNLYIPANAMVLTWIAAVAAAVATGAGGASSEPSPWDGLRRGGRIALGILLLVYSIAWSVFEARYREDVRAERLFCRFGICDTYAVVSALSSEDGSAAEVDLGLLQSALRRSPSDPIRWADLGAALEHRGRIEEARYCFERALEQAPNSPPTRWSVAEFYANRKENGRALELTAPVIEISAPHRAPMLAWYEERGFSATEVSAALGPYPNAIRAYLLHLMREERLGDAQIAWAQALAQRNVDLDTARGYISFLMNQHSYEAAAEAWAAFLGDRREGYRDSNWVYNGSFERPLSGSPLDWRIGDAETTETSLDPDVAYDGKQSLRIRFSGKENVQYNHVSQIAVVPPGRYRFEAFVKTEEITTSEGIRIEIYDAEDGRRLRFETEPFVGSRDWTKFEKEFLVGPQTRAVRIQVIRRPVRLKFDQRISGTAWIDSVKLEKVR